ncbi:MAG TPA: hypothetical protein VJ277_13365, partial [Gemmatimonadales bacterium]|nr:hypothetical protein [Gemmatimonadales bacterium]
VCYVVWDDAASAGRFLRSAAGLHRTPRPQYRAALDSLDLEGRAATRYVLAPSGWARWRALPAVTVTAR